MSIGLHAAAALGAARPALWPWMLGGVALNHLVLGAAGMTPRSTLLGPNLRCLPPTGRPEVALTFDDGPDPEVTPRVLDLLDRHGARASFFCVGARARAHPDLVREVARRGHAVENHTARHLLGFAALPPVLLRREVAQAQAVLTELARRPPRFFRPPAGLRSPLLQPVLEREGVRLVSWTRRALDGVRTNAGAAAGRLRRGLAAGDVLVMHDGGPAWRPGAERPVLAVLPRLLERLAELELRAVTLEEGVAPFVDPTRPDAAAPPECRRA